VRRPVDNLVRGRPRSKRGAAPFPPAAGVTRSGNGGLAETPGRRRHPARGRGGTRPRGWRDRFGATSVARRLTPLRPGPSVGHFPARSGRSYDNFIGGKWVPRCAGQYFDNSRRSPARCCARWRARRPRTSSSRSTPRTRRPDAWGRTSATERANHPQQDRRPHRAEPRALASRDLDNGKPIRETMAADLPLAIDHFRYFAGCMRAQEGSHRRARPRHGRLPLPRAARRRGADHPVELPAADGGVEARARPSPPATAWC
jgi:hypothetical protein